MQTGGVSLSLVFEAQRDDLVRLEQSTRLRSLTARSGIDFSSNDYLGLGSSDLLAHAANEALERGVPVGSGGSRLLRGNHTEHEALEAEAAAFFGCEAALYFSTGYAANAALLSTLPQRGDLVVFDELIHASAHEGMKLGRADVCAARHNDVSSFEDQIKAWRSKGNRGRMWLAVESLYSMDGDQAPLDALQGLANRHDAILLIDEAHATGVFGPEGRGLAAHLEGQENIITLRTCGKALGAEGALICGPAVCRDFLINRGRGFIFSTAPSPLMATIVRASLRIVQEMPALRDQLWQRIHEAEKQLARLGVGVSGSQILPVIVGEDAAAMAQAQALQNMGFDVRGIRPPTVPTGTARLRISITNNIELDQISALAEAIEKVQAAFA